MNPHQKFISIIQKTEIHRSCLGLVGNLDLKPNQSESKLIGYDLSEFQGCDGLNELLVRKLIVADSSYSLLVLKGRDKDCQKIIDKIATKEQGSRSLKNPEDFAVYD